MRVLRVMLSPINLTTSLGDNPEVSSPARNGERGTSDTVECDKPASQGGRRAGGNLAVGYPMPHFGVGYRMAWAESSEPPLLAGDGCYDRNTMSHSRMH